MAEAERPHVLVVEDYHHLRDLQCEILETSGFRTSAAMSADAAMAIVTAGDVEVILTDIVLAGSERDGVWLLRQVHRVAPGIPVIAVTGQPERLDEFIGLGFALVLVKPLDIETLGDVVKGVLAKPA
jgi:DNA-binding NtrC family response regulator